MLFLLHLDIVVSELKSGESRLPLPGTRTGATTAVLLGQPPCVLRPVHNVVEFVEEILVTCHGGPLTYRAIRQLSYSKIKLLENSFRRI